MFLFLTFSNFELVSIDLEINSALGKKTYFYQKCGRSNAKSSETRNLKIWDKTDVEVVGPKSLHIKDLKIHGSSIHHIRFSFYSYTF